MRKYIILILFIFTLNFSLSFAAPLTGGVEYNVEDARLELQNNRPRGIDYWLMQDNFTDTNYNENRKMLLNGNVALTDRTLAQFSDGSYGVVYKKDLRHVWYYNQDGTLLYAEERVSLEYPYRAYKYTPEAELVNMSLRVSDSETFIFDKLGRLIGHWIGSKCYDESGNVTMTRQIKQD